MPVWLPSVSVGISMPMIDPPAVTVTAPPPVRPGRRADETSSDWPFRQRRRVKIRGSGRDGPGGIDRARRYLVEQFGHCRQPRW